MKLNFCNSRQEMGEKAGREAGDMLRALLGSQETVRMIFAAAPSQNETLEALCGLEGIDWSRVEAFHMDEYVGLSADHPAAFGNYLKEHVFGRLPFGRIEYIRVDAEDAQAECERYTALLQEKPVDIVMLGIGENGHIAFNDPGVADFKDKAWVKEVELDEVCRMQQVHDGCFESLDKVPKTALTLTIPALVSAGHMYCSVPAASKANAVRDAVEGPINEACPATILRKHADSHLYLDRDSARLIRIV